MGATPQVAWEDVERALDQALTLAPDDRSAFLEQTRSGNPALAAEVERLLIAVEDSGGFLAESGLAFAPALVARVAEHCSLMPGDRFENYEVVRELGRGGMATVYLAQDLRHGRQVALKVLLPELSASFGADRFAREIAFAARLNHPHILPLHDSGTIDLGVGEQVLFYSMPYVDGRSLRDRLREEPQLPIPEAIRIASQVADALEYAHRHDVVHRDIKPENILLTDEHAFVADLGIARALDRAATDGVTQPGLVLGTPAYMSPEQSASAPLDGRSDVYSLGCVLYEMLAGHPPFAGTTAQAVLARHAVDPVPSLRTVRRTVPAGVEQAIERALAKVPADRFATAREFAEALAAPDPAPEPDPELPGRAPAPLSPRQRKVTLAALAVLPLVLMGDWGLPRRPEQIALDPKRVIVAPFTNNTGDPSLTTLGDMTADQLASGIAEIQLVQVVDARGVQGADAGTEARLGNGDVRTLAQGLGAGAVLWGSYHRRGDSLLFQAQLSDTRSGQIVVPIQSATGPAADPSTGIELLRQHAMAALAWYFDPQVASIEDVSRPSTFVWHFNHPIGALENSSRPSTYEAFREFIAGGEFHDVDHWRRAYALDSTFTLPLIEIARQGDYFGGCDLTDSIAEALRLRHDRLPALDRARLDAVVAGCHGQRGLQLEAARAAVNAAGRSEDDALYLNRWLRRTGFLREAVAVYERFDPANAGNGLIMPYHLLGEHEKELAAAEAALRADPGKLGFMACEARANVGLGRLDQMEQVLEAMLKVPTNAETWGLTQAFAFSQVARDLEAHGYSAEARDLHERALAWYRSRPLEEQDRNGAHLCRRPVRGRTLGGSPHRCAAPHRNRGPG